jgi:hypothetical protein
MKKSVTGIMLLMPWALLALTSCALTKHTAHTPPSKYLAVWTGDEDGKDSDFLTIIDADSHSSTY